MSIVQISYPAYELVKVNLIGLSENVSVISNEYIVPQNYRRNIYVIGIDGMVSKKAMKTIFSKTSSEAYEFLEENGFMLYDINSPGDQTLTTYGNLLSSRENTNPRVVRGLMNGVIPSPFYERMKLAGYNRQFFNDSDYFGVDAGKLESFLPSSYTFSVCNYLDNRWGYYACRLPKLFDEKNSDLITLEDKINFYINNVKIKPNEKWVTINHIWFPGHTIGDYNGANYDDFNQFRNYYLDSQQQLKVVFSKIISHILLHDNNPVIIFMGDHGSYALRSNSKFVFDGYEPSEMPDLLSVDARSALLAVYPKDFCIGNVNLNDTTGMFLQFFSCLNGY
ncbi:hypothetical protein [Limnohabitans sp.]|uniref:hypothetical protein n=1 Tax=Limnohabitans sp. TaxID=1907725 RepID=UPI0038B98DB0